MNSSQVMCINFFKKFFEKEEYEGYLLAVLQCCGISIEEYKIENAVFEYEPDHEEGTNFDFYLILDDGKKFLLSVSIQRQNLVVFHLIKEILINITENGITYIKI